MQTMLKVVDFPAPFGPSSPRTSPFCTPKVLEHTAYTVELGYVLLSSIALIRYFSLSSSYFISFSWDMTS